jgi:hypothetical protein
MKTKKIQSLVKLVEDIKKHTDKMKPKHDAEIERLENHLNEVFK